MPMKCIVRPVVAVKSRELSKATEPWLRVMTYNVLAQQLIRREVYSTNGNNIKWAVRFPALVEELEAYQPNLLFLQEVDKGKINNWKDTLENLGMEVEYSRAETKAHGLIIAWKKSLFDLLPSSVTTVDYDKSPLLPLQTITGNIGLLLVLQRKETEDLYVVGTTHLYWHGKANYERLRQTLLFVNAAKRLQACNKLDGNLIIGADLNSSPWSPAYQCLSNDLSITDTMKTHLHASVDHPCFGRFRASADESRPTMLQNSPDVVDKLVELAEQTRAQAPKLELTSCYKNALGSEPPFTNWTEGFKDTIDYIFVSKPFEVCGVLHLPSASEMGPEPNSLPRANSEGKGYPSDHLPLMAELF